MAVRETRILELSMSTEPRTVAQASSGDDRRSKGDDSPTTDDRRPTTDDLPTTND